MMNCRYMGGFLDLGRGFPSLNEKNPHKKNPDNSDTIGWSDIAINISNRLRMLPDTLPDVHLPLQLLESSEIGPFQDGGRGI